MPFRAGRCAGVAGRYAAGRAAGCIDHPPASQSKHQANPSKRKANSSKCKANLSKCQANRSKTKQTKKSAKQTQANVKQNEANAIYTDTDTDTVTDTVTVSHSLTRARERNNPLLRIAKRASLRSATPPRHGKGVVWHRRHGARLAQKAYLCRPKGKHREARQR